MLVSNFSGYGFEAGCDEAGRGCLAGPVFAAAVILPKDYFNVELTDSKKLSEKKRNKLRIEIEKEAIAYSVAEVSSLIIDEINILNASILAMHQALSGLDFLPEFIIVDGNRFKPFKEIKHQCIIKGDAKYFSIAAASVLAKTHRDEYMKNLAVEFPMYNWQQNKGYPTKQHRELIKANGICIHYRKSFRIK